jgi:hypothetical protein
VIVFTYAMAYVHRKTASLSKIPTTLKCVVRRRSGKGPDRLTIAWASEFQVTIRDYLRHSNLSVTKKYLQAASKTRRDAQTRLIEAILPVHLLPGKLASRLHPDSKSAKL